jgi:hypothetical protein
MRMFVILATAFITFVATLSLSALGVAGEYLAPGVYVQETPFSSHPIEGVHKSTKRNDQQRINPDASKRKGQQESGNFTRCMLVCDGAGRQGPPGATYNQCLNRITEQWTMTLIPGKSCINSSFGGTRPIPAAGLLETGPGLSPQAPAPTGTPRVLGAVAVTGLR